MSHLRWYWIVVCSASLLVTSCGGKKSAEVIKDESQKSVVLISHLKGHGSGFFIEGEAGVCTVLTAKHVVPEGTDIYIQTMMSKLPSKPLNIRRADNVDLAVVTFKPLDGNCPFPALKLGDSNNMVLAQPIHISSYPGGVNGQQLKQSFYISNVSDKTPGGADGYEIGYKTDTLGGTSGSPVLNEFGEVIAVHGRSYMNKDSNSLGNDRAYLDLGVPINLYKQDTIAQVKGSPSTDEKKSTPKINQSETNNKDSTLKVNQSETNNKDSTPKTNQTELTLNLNSLMIWAIAIGSGTIIIIIANLKFKGSKTTYRKPAVDRYASTKKEETIPNSPKLKPLHPPDPDLLKKKKIADYDRAIQLEPGNSNLYRIRGDAKYDVGSKKEAIADYNKAIELDPMNYNLYKIRGDAKFSSSTHDLYGDYQGDSWHDIPRNKKDAIADYNKAIELDPKNSSLYIIRAEAHLASGSLDSLTEAIADYDKAIEIDPDNSEFYQIRGDVKYKYTALRRKEEAIADYDKAIEIDPDNSEFYRIRGDAKSGLERQEEAISDYNEMIEIDPNNSNFYRIRGDAKSVLGKQEEAIVDYDKAITIDPNNSKFYEIRGTLKFAMGNNEKALSDYDKAIELKGFDNSTLYQIRGDIKL